MIAIEFHDLSMPEAEEVIVALWCCFEEYDVPSPSVTFKFYRGARASVQVHIQDAALAQVVGRFLSNWNVPRRIDAGRSARGRPMRRPRGWTSIVGSALETRH
jgi:hypothetical protein